jgi:hypothetical protein
LKKDICQNQQCVSANCESQYLCDSECSSNSDCCPADSHTECANGVCECMGGAGANECQADEDCTYHNVCIFEQCLTINGFGDDECTGFDDNECRIKNCENNNPPYAENLQAGNSTGYCTGIPGIGTASFSWEYKDEDENYQAKFRFQVDDNADFSSPEVDRIFEGLSNPSGSINEQSVFVKQIATIRGGDYIKYNTSYYWRVMVWEDNNCSNNVSEWIYYDRFAGTTDPALKATYTFEYSHPSPVPQFDPLPETADPGDSVYFNDMSICYSSSGPYPCESINPNICRSNKCYTWTIENKKYYTIGDISHIFANKGIYSVKLQICDEIGCCEISKDIVIKPGASQNLPQWKEISPF